MVHPHPGAGVLETTTAEGVLLLAAGTRGHRTLIELLALLPRSILEAGFFKSMLMDNIPLSDPNLEMANA